MSMKTVLRSCLLSGILLLSYGLSIAQDRVVSGNVSSSADGNPIPGVNVVIKGTTTGTITDLEGEYKLTIPSGNVLSFSYAF